MNGAPSLRTRVLRGGVYLILRQGLGSLIGFAAVMWIVRAIGPAEYGLAAAAISTCGYALEVFPLGIGAWLVREDGDLSAEDRDQAFTCLLASGLAGLAIALALVPLLGLAIGLERFGLLAATACGVIPFSVLATFPRALLERALDFRRIAFIEFTSQLAGHSVSVALTLARFGALALVAGFWTREVVALVLLARSAGYRPRLRWDSARARKITSYGFSYGFAGWVWQAGDTIAPLLIGRLAGAEVLGIVTLTNRFIDTMNLVPAAARRLGFAALATVQRDRARLSKACSEAMIIQVLSLGALVWAFGICAHLFFLRLLGGRWEGLLVVYPLLALATLVNGAFSFHVQVLHVLQRSWDVAVYHGVRVLLMIAGLAWFLPAHGLRGYGYGVLLGLAGLPLAHVFVARRGLRIHYASALALQAVFGVGLFYRELGWPVAFAPLAIALWPSTWRMVRDHARSMAGRQQVEEPVARIAEHAASGPDRDEGK